MSENSNKGDVIEADFLSKSAEQTRLFAVDFAKKLSPDSFIAFSGDLGVGKTTFVKGLAEGLGVSAKIKSPSFNIMSVYESSSGVTLVHIDAYRLSSAEDFDNLLVDEIAQSPRCVCVEWWSNVAECVPPDAIEISMSIEEDDSHRILVRRMG